MTATWADRHRPSPVALPAAKHCTHCHKLKPLADYPSHKKTADGRNSWCRTCCAQARRLRYASQREKTAAANRAYAAALAVLRERHRTEFDELLSAARRQEGFSS